MGLFSSFRRKRNSEERVITETAAASSPAAGQNLGCVRGDNVGRCIYANAKFIGLVEMAYGRRDEGRPNFMGFLSEILEALPPNLYRLRLLDEGSDFLYQPSEYSEFFSPASGVSWANYIYDCGDVAYFQELKIQGRGIEVINGHRHLPLNWPTQFAALSRSSDMAIAQCLGLLKYARENNDTRIEKIMLEDPPYLFALVLFSLMLHVNMFHMEHANSVVFIPDELLSAPINTPLQFFETDIDPDAPAAVLPSALKSIRFMPNEDNAIALGSQRLAGRRGIIVRTDRNASEYLDTIADNFIRGLSR